MTDLNFPGNWVKEISKGPLEKTRASLLPTNHSHLDSQQQPKGLLDQTATRFALCIHLFLIIPETVSLQPSASFTVVFLRCHTHWDPGVQQHQCSAGQASSRQPGWVNLCPPAQGRPLAQRDVRWEDYDWHTLVNAEKQLVAPQGAYPRREGLSGEGHFPTIVVEESSEHQLPWGPNFTRLTVP